ncbi:MAG: hypothetical protein II399_00500 [Lachnospiraceae bacterium]|nr:hypothetical protein [Lachnospiraceae bacterium]
MSEKNESVEQKAEAQQEAPKVIYIYKKHKNKKKKKTNPKPCHNGGYRMADLEKVMTPLELAQYNKKKEDLNKALTELNKLKTQANNLSEYTDQVFNRLSLGNIDGYIKLLSKQVKPLLENIKRWKSCVNDVRADIKGILQPAIKRLDNINSKEPFKPQEVLRRFTADVKPGESTPKKGSYTLSRHDALVLVKEISNVITENPKAQRIEIFIASN